jgi:outer membrane protein assembly factor BamE
VVSRAATAFDDKGAGLLYHAQDHPLFFYHSKMRKLLSCLFLSLLSLVTSVLTGCADETKPDVYHKSLLEDLPFVHKMTVQQGNIITKEEVDQLQPGMNKRQVRYLLGTPLLTDFFNSDRWDYVYTIRRGHAPEEQRKLTVFFQDDVLVRTEGNVRPEPGAATVDDPKEIIVSVPDYQEHKGWIGSGLEAVGIGRNK